MRLQIVIALTIIILTTFIKAQKISDLLTDRRYVEKQINCILNRSHCDIIGNKIKGLLPEALYNDCRRCTSRQKAHARTLIDFMQRNYPEEWNLIVRHYSDMRYIRHK